MLLRQKIQGVYAAAVTPIGMDGEIDVDAVPTLLAFLAQRGCHGALLLGTTGEGPSFSPEERAKILQAGRRVHETFPEFRLIAGTGTPSLDETITLTKMAFDLGYQAVVVLPPYYFRNVSDEGLLDWFSQVIQRGVPADGRMLGYHIPAVSGVGLSFELVSSLHDRYPHQFAGIKDSSGDRERARHFADRFGLELVALVGNDRLMSHALENHLGGCITAMANLHSPYLRAIWDAFENNANDPASQVYLDQARAVMEAKPPFPSYLKALLHTIHKFPKWLVRPPLQPLADEVAIQATTEMLAIDHG